MQAAIKVTQPANGSKLCDTGPTFELPATAGLAEECELVFRQLSGTAAVWKVGFRNHRAVVSGRFETDTFDTAFCSAARTDGVSRADRGSTAITGNTLNVNGGPANVFLTRRPAQRSEASASSIACSRIAGGWAPDSADRSLKTK